MSEQSPREHIAWFNTRPVRIVRVVLAAVCVAAGSLTILVVAALGHCSAFGGRCPRTPTWDGEVFGSAAAGAAIAIAVPIFLHRPSRRRLTAAVAVAAVGAALVGALVVAATAG